MRRLSRLPLTLCFGLAVMVSLIAPMARAADRERVDAFLEVTGFDVALESIRLSADSAPQMLGIDADAFGSEWSRLVREVFETDLMLDMGAGILAQALSDDALEHASDFYASDLGQRLVAAENASHMEEDDAAKAEAGDAILNGLRGIDSPRVDLLARLNGASDVEAGVIELQMEEPDLREAMRAQEPEMRASIKENALAGAAYTYQAFSDEEVLVYAKALEDPQMQEVYALMNAVQFEIMANRFEEVAQRLGTMQPSQDL
jgi:hypothetical protein